MTKEYCVYKHTTPSGKVYIGVTCKKPQRRWENGKGYILNRHFNQAIEKYGWENIEHEIVVAGLTKEQASKEEQRQIALHHANDPAFGYNHTSGGYIGYEYNEESLKALQERGKRQFADQEFKKRFDEAMRNPERRKRISDALTEYYKSPEAREKLSRAQQKKWESINKEKFKQIIKETHTTTEYKRQMSDILKQRWTNEEYRQSMMGGGNPNATGVSQYSLDGQYIKTFDSMADAEREIGVDNAHCNIIACIKGRQKTAYGFKWQYAVNNSIEDRSRE